VNIVTGEAAGRGAVAVAAARNSSWLVKVNKSQIPGKAGDQLSSVIEFALRTNNRIVSK